MHDLHVSSVDHTEAPWKLSRPNPGHSHEIRDLAPHASVASTDVPAG